MSAIHMELWSAPDEYICMSLFVRYNAFHMKFMIIKCCGS